MANTPLGNLRNATNVINKAKDVKSTSQLTPGAKEGADWNSTNETKEYVVENPPTGGPLGGKNSGS